MWLTVLGIIILCAAIIDLLWTTLGTHGGGPVSAPMTSVMWSVFEKIGKKRRHRLLSFVGSIILFDVLVFWIAMVWIGWTLVFYGRHAIVDSSSGKPSDFPSVITFVAAQMFTPGTSQYIARSSLWKVTGSIAAGSGLVLITVAITYIVAVLSAAVEKRTLGSYIWDMGATPEGIIERAWAGDRFEDIQQHLVEVVGAIELFAENHLAYPVLQYFHSENRRNASPLRIAALFDTLMLLTAGVVDAYRPPRMALLSACDAIRGLAETLEGEFVKPADEAPPYPDISILRSRDIPAVNDEDFRRAVDKESAVRRRLAGLVDKAGWTWADVFSRELNP